LSITLYLYNNKHSF